MKDDSIYLFCVVVWSVLVKDEFWGQLEKSKKGQQIRVRPPPPPPFRAMPERNRFLLWEVFPYPSLEPACISDYHVS